MEISLTSTLWALWFLFVLIWIAVSIMYQFHWSSYAKGDLVVRRGAIFYYLGSVLILGIAALLIATL